MLTKAYVKVTNMFKSNKGMEMLQAILLVALAVALGTLIFYFVQKSGQGLLDNVGEKLDTWFNSSHD